MNGTDPAVNSFDELRAMPCRKFPAPTVALSQMPTCVTVTLEPLTVGNVIVPLLVAPAVVAAFHFGVPDGCFLPPVVYHDADNSFAPVRPGFAPCRLTYTFVGIFHWVVPSM